MDTLIDNEPTKKCILFTRFWLSNLMKMQGIILLKHFVATEVGGTFPQHYNIITIFIVNNIRAQQNTIKTVIRTKKFKFL